MADAKRDQNRVPTLLGVSSADGITPVAVYVDPTTHRMYVDIPSGTGTVQSVSVTTANGVSGSVLNPTTTPAITITLGAITPTSVNGLIISTTTGTFTLTNAKTLSVTNSLTLSGTDSTTMTFPSTSATIARTDAGQTFTGTQVFSSPTINGTPTGTGVASAATASTLAIRDANGNTSMVNLLEGFTTTATAGGTTTLTVSSNYLQFFTGTQAQTVTLPVATTLINGQQFQIVNNSTGLVTVQTSGTNTLIILGASTSAIVTCVNTAGGTGTASWSSSYAGANATSGKVASFSNTLTFAGTDGTTMTFPSTSATIARTDAANTFTGVQTMTSPSITTSIVTGSSSFDVFNTTATTLNIGGAATTLTIGGTPTGAATFNFATNATAAATTKTLNIGTGGAASSTTNVNIGSSNGGTTTVNSTTISLGGTTGATTTGTIELGNASDTTLSRSAAGVLAVEGVVIPSISSTNTLTNKRVTPRTGTTSSSATPTINTDNVDFYSITAQTVDITSFTTNLSGTPTDGQKLWIAITGTAARAITWGTSFESSTVTLPTTTVTTNRLDVGFVWNTATSKWRCVATA